ncbi:MAG: sodium-dependent transporter [Cellvibrionales bacterium TMED148]|nr:sodium-dependent transporter [Porticoccaceae bacterium]RPG89391.1 MAG: sodium-dependent transporter [Cellvibrionales bacterium TMED148]
MSSNTRGIHGIWMSRWTFIMAATGSAVGLGNLWKFPYVVGNNGGGAFVLIYFLCMLLVGVPVMMAEVVLGREGRNSPITGMSYVVKNSECGRAWQLIGWIGVIAGLLILSFYAVIAGWGLHYILEVSNGNVIGVDGESAASLFADLTSSPAKLIAWQTIFLGMCLLVVTGGVKKGLGAAVEILMPLLFVMLLVMLIYAILKGNFVAACRFLFEFDIASVSWRAILEAMGLAFFTLSIGMGAIMAYGAYMPEGASIGRTVLIISFFDSIVAIIAGLIIFSIVFSTSGIEPTAGPGLMFISLPVAFGNMPAGQFIGIIFFILVVIAAWSSAISLLEPAAAWLVEAAGFTRFKASFSLVGFVWLLGLGSVFSFNLGKDFTLAGFTIFDGLDFVTSNIFLPVCGLAISVFVGFVMNRDVLSRQMADLEGYLLLIKTPSSSKTLSLRVVWDWVLRFVAPIAITAIFFMGVYDNIRF